MAKFKNSIFSLEQENALHVYRAQEPYTHSSVNRQSEHYLTSFNLRLNNHRKDTKKANSILACKNFQ